MAVETEQVNREQDTDAFALPPIERGRWRRYQAEPPINYISDIATNMSIPEEFTLGGWVYALSNEAMPGLYKIGMTTTDPEIRAKEISHGTGVPLPYTVEMAFFSSDPRRDELAIHEYLQPKRINPSREFFQCTESEVAMAFDDCGLLERNSNVETLADSYQIISFDAPKRLNLVGLFDELDISVFGDLNAAAEGLIRLSISIVKKYESEGMSLVLHDGSAQRILTEYQQMYDYHRAKETEEQKVSGIYGPKQPGGF